MIISRVLIDFDPDSRFLASVDPITLTGLALAGMAGFAGSSAMSSSSAPPPAATPTAAPPPPPMAAPPAQAPSGKPGAGVSAQPSFIGSSATPTSDSGQKTLVGA